MLPRSFSNVGQSTHQGEFAAGNKPQHMSPQRSASSVHFIMKREADSSIVRPREPQEGMGEASANAPRGGMHAHRPIATTTALVQERGTPPSLVMAPPPRDFCPFLPRALQPPEHVKYVSIHNNNSSSSSNILSPPRKDAPGPSTLPSATAGSSGVSPLRPKHVIDACGGKEAFIHRMFAMYHPTAVAASSGAAPPQAAAVATALIDSVDTSCTRPLC